MFSGNNRVNYLHHQRNLMVVTYLVNTELSQMLLPSSQFLHNRYNIKRDNNPNDKHALLERALLTTNFDTSIIKIGWKMGKLCAFNMANI